MSGGLGAFLLAVDLALAAGCAVAAGRVAGLLGFPQEPRREPGSPAAAERSLLPTTAGCRPGFARAAAEPSCSLFCSIINCLWAMLLVVFTFGVEQCQDFG